MMVISYLRKPRNFYIQDMGSIHGTFLKLNPDQKCTLKNGHNFQMGTEIYLNVLDVKLPSKWETIENNSPVDPFELVFMKFLGFEYS